MIDTTGTQTLPYLFCNIGWMEAYKGTARIVGGGAYVEKHNTGFEMCNFLPYQGKVYGYVGLPGRRKINIKRLEGGTDDSSVSNVTVIWTAKRPQVGTVVIGWYNNATVHREFQEFPSSFPQKKKHHIAGYRIKALENNAKLLPIDQRTLDVPKAGDVEGGMGQSNIWYADKPNLKPFLKNVERLIQGKKGIPKRKQPHKTDPEKNAQVEKAAINTTTRHFENTGYTVKSVEKDNIGWDLEATRGKRKLLIEVKGLSGEALSVELTPKEYQCLDKQERNYRLCVVSTALNNPDLYICRYSEKKRKWIVKDHKTATIEIKPRKSASININLGDRET